MAQIEVKVPQLSESVAEATLLAWHKKVGEPVARDENMIDIETDKVVLELPAPAAGVIIQIIKDNGATVVAGEVIAIINMVFVKGTKEAALTQRQTSVLKGESLFNDASGIVGFQFAIAAAVSGVFEVGDSAIQFVFSFFGGAIFGLAVGMIADLLFESLRSFGWETTTSRILMELFLPFILYLGAEAVHVSGILSVVTAGLIIRFDRTGIGPNVARTNIVSSSVWGVFSFTLNGTVFILLGMLLPNAMSASWDDPQVSNWLLLVAILAVSAVVIVMRFLWISLMLRLARDTTTGKRRKMTAKRWRSAAVMTFGGPKGTITLSLMFTIPYTLAAGADFPMRDELIFIAAGVIVVTLLLAVWSLNGFFQGWGWPPCARLLTHWYSRNERGFWWGCWNMSINARTRRP